MNSAASPTTDGHKSDEISSNDILFLRALIKERSAIELDASKGYLLTSRLAPLAREERIASVTELVDRVRRAPRGRLESRLVEAMTTNETSFFRDSHPFVTLVDDLIPSIARGPAPAPVTIWCAACSSGQEPYSIAIAVHDRHPDLFAAKRLRIVATDLSPQMVERTKSGKYTQLEVNRGLPARQMVRFFDQQGRDWVAKPELRSVIDAKVLNLIDSWVGVPRCDVVFMRNVLIYFAPADKKRILERVRREVLKPGGYLFLGSSETTLGLDAEFTRRDFGKTICYQAPGAPAR